jgi:hypothetical protein
MATGPTFVATRSLFAARQMKTVVDAFSTETRFSLQQCDCEIEKMGLRQDQNLIEDCLYSDVPLSPTLAPDGCMSQSGTTSWQSTVPLWTEPF